MTIREDPEDAIGWFRALHLHAEYSRRELQRIRLKSCSLLSTSENFDDTARFRRYAQPQEDERLEF